MDLQGLDLNDYPGSVPFSSLSSGLQLGRSKFSKAKSEENLAYNSQGSLTSSSMFNQESYKTTVHQFGPVGILKASINGFSSIVLDVTYGANQWTRTIAHQTFVTFYEIVHKHYKIPHHIAIPHNILFAEVDIDVPLHRSQRLFADHVFLFISELISSQMFLTEHKIGHRLCILLDNDCQVLETAYELQRVMRENEALKLKLNTLTNMDIPVVDESSNSQPIGNYSQVLNKLLCLKVDQSEGDLRANVFHMMELIVKQVLGCRSFEYGSSLFKTFLPSEPIFISICLHYRKGKADWYKDLIGYLCRLSILSPKEASSFALGKESSKFTWLKVDHVSFNSREHLILCHINGFNVVISSNEFENLCLNGFYEEFSVQNTHFKEIFALIRAMVFYEMRLYSYKNFEKLLYLDCYLLCFVFKAYVLILEKSSCVLDNYHDMIKQVFGYLEELDWDDLLQKRNFLILQKFISSESQYMSRNYSSTILKYQSKWDFALKEEERSQVHLNSILPNKNTKANVSQIQFAMSRLKGFIERNELCELQVSAYLLKDCALHTVNLPFPIHVGDSIEIFTNIRYFCLVLFSVIEEEPLLRLIEEVLFDKGPLPVGEIGKVLQVMTNNTDFTQTLKERFGGLKKLLEQHTHQFYLATDHPYNPKVYVTKYLTQEDLYAIQKGNVPVQYLSRVCPTMTEGKVEEDKTPKRRRSRKKRSSHHHPMDASSVSPPGSIPELEGNTGTTVGTPIALPGQSGFLSDDDLFPAMAQLSVDQAVAEQPALRINAAHDNKRYF